MQAFRQMDLTDHGRQHMRGLQIEIIIRPVEVGRHHGDIVRTVLQVVTLAHLDTRYLGDRVRLVGIFQGRCQQAILRHRLRSLTGIDAGASQE